MIDGRLTGARARIVLLPNRRCKDTATFLNNKKKTLNNVKANVFVWKGFPLERKHLIYIYVRV